MRAELVEKLEQRIDGGVLALLGTVNAALAAVDAVPEDVDPAARAVVADDGEVIRLIFYTTLPMVRLAGSILTRRMP